MMVAQFISGPLHQVVMDVGDEPPERWIAPIPELGRDGKEPEFRPVVGPWDDVTRAPRYDIYEYERVEDKDNGAVYLLKVLHRADGSKLEF